MPNHVFNFISVEEKYADKLAEIAKVGLCRYYKPMPEELVGTTSPQRMGKTISQEEHDRLTEKYGTSDWYTWASREWGTKWGCYKTSYEDGGYTFQTAWSPPNEEIFRMLMEDIPSFYYEWEEEQGYGAIWKAENGDFYREMEWDLPEWSTKKWDELTGDMLDEYREKVYGYGYVTLLKEDYSNGQGNYKRGYYLDYILEEFLHKDFRIAVDKLKQRHKKWESARTN